MANPDEPCGVCGDTRENHGDHRHQFSADGVLKKLEPAAPPRQQPPRHRDDSPVMEHNLVLRLTTRLVEKGILDAHDLLYVMGAPHVPDDPH